MLNLELLFFNVFGDEIIPYINMLHMRVIDILICQYIGALVTAKHKCCSNNRDFELLK